MAGIGQHSLVFVSEASVPFAMMRILASLGMTLACLFDLRNGFAPVSTNNITSLPAGVWVDPGNSAVRDIALWGQKVPVGMTISEPGAILSNANYYGEPGFILPLFQIGPHSAALNAGANVGVSTDIDGELRPNGSMPDMGANEFYCKALTQVILTGPTTSISGTANTFAAAATPLTAPRWLTHTWRATGQSPITNTTFKLSDAASLTWTVTGMQSITATASNCGGGIYLWQSDATVRGNLVQGNTCTFYGGGMLIVQGSPTITANRILSNAAGSSGGLGLETSDYFTVTNNIIVSNTYGINAHTDASGTLDYNDVWGNTTQDYDLPGTLEPGPHDIQADPRFVSAAENNYHLRSGSPCINAGMNAGVTTDIDGQPRPEGAAPDIGADEYGEWRIFLPLVLNSS